MSGIIARESGQLRTLEEIRDDLRTHKLRAAQYIVEIGKDLTDAKAQLQHGEWLCFLDSVGFSARSAQNYMRLAEAAKTRPKLGELPYSKALALIEAPESVQDQLLQEGVEDKSAAEIRRLKQALMEEHSARSREKDAAKEAGRKADELQRELEQLRAHPATVEVVPEDYEEIKLRLREAEQAAADAEERAEAAMLVPEPEADGDALSVQDVLAAANDFAIKAWYLPHMGTAFAAMDERQRQQYRILLQSVSSLCARALETLDKAVAIEGAM